MSNSLDSKDKYIKLIYGDNGSGKSQYYKQQIGENEKGLEQIKRVKENNYISLNYNIGQWYSNGVFSEWAYKEKILNNQMIKLNDDLIKKIKDHFSLNAKKDYLKTIGFKDYNNLLNWYIKIKDNINNLSELEIKKEDLKKYFDDFILLSDSDKFMKYKNSINNLSDDVFHILIVYCSLKYSEVTQINLLEKAKNYEDQILNIIEEMKEDIQTNTDIDLDKISKLDANILKQIRSNVILNSEGILQLIKNTITIKFSKEIEEIFKIFKSKEEIKEKCINFQNLMESNKLDKPIQFKGKEINIKLKDEYSLELNLDEFSDGEKIFLLFDILLRTFSKSKKIFLLDDIFEKLDINNIYYLLNDIFTTYNESDDIKIEILTHDVNFFEIFKKMVDDFPEKLNNIGYFKPKLNSTGGKYKLEKYESSLTFKDFLSNVLNYIEKENDHKDEWNDYILFAKLFNREKTFNNWIHLIKIKNSNDDIKNYNDQIKENFTIELYDFLSENIFHYSPNIDINKTKYKLIKEYFNDSIFNENNLDTVKLYESLIIRFKNNNYLSSKWKLNLSEASLFLEELLFFIEKEKEYYLEKLKKNNSLILNGKKWNFYSKLYEDRNKISESEHKRRNKLFHILEYSLKFDSFNDNKVK